VEVELERINVSRIANPGLIRSGLQIQTSWILLFFIPPDDYSGFVRYSSFTRNIICRSNEFLCTLCSRGVPRVAEALAEAQPLAETTFIDQREIIEYGLQPIGTGYFELDSVGRTNGFPA